MNTLYYVKIGIVLTFIKCFSFTDIIILRRYNNKLALRIFLIECKTHIFEQSKREDQRFAQHMT